MQNLSYSLQVAWPLMTANHKPQQVSPSNNHLNHICKKHHNWQSMDILLKQTRSRFGDIRPENKEESSSTRDKKVPLQRTQPLREKKRGGSWIIRQLSRQMSSDFDLSGTEYPAAVAAAAYAVQSLEESKTREPPERLKSALKSSDETLRRSFKDHPEKTVRTVPSPKKKLSFADNHQIIGTLPAAADKDALPRAPSVRKPSTSPEDKDLKITTGTKKPESPVDKRTHIATLKPGPGDSKADAWEKQEMARIQERYEKLRAKIVNWEAKKRKNAKRKIEKIEAELDKRRAKATQSYRTDMARIEGIAGGAKLQAEQNRKKEEAKVKEKANKIRLTGKFPAMCLCC